MDAYFVNQVDREQKLAHRRVSFTTNKLNPTTIRFQIGS
jgi:hypothetical protein